MASIFISDLWNKWNIRGIIMLSLLFQIFLILFAPLRKKIANKYIILLLWLVYLMADAIVVYGIGQISHSQGNPSVHGAEVNGAVQVFWASFLLLHLGGPDTITAFSLEDSSLWKRHLLSFISQANAAIYVFVQIFPTDESLVIPTMLVFSLGVIKNAERILALHLSSLPRMRELMNPLELDTRLENVLSQALDGYEYSDREAKLRESIVVEHAYGFFQIFKVFLIDLIFTSAQRDVSHKYFHKVSPLDALRVISVELQFMYEMLHTKALAVRYKLTYIFRFVVLIVLAMAFVLFNYLKKHQLSEVDIKITHSLLCGGIALEMIALFMLVFSDWTVSEIMWRHTTSARQNTFLHKVLYTLDKFLHKVIYGTDYLRKPRFVECEVEPSDDHIYKTLDTLLIFRRWSESISACNLFSEIMEESPRKIKKCNRGWIIIVFSNISSLAEKITSSFRQTCEAVFEGCCPRNTSMIAHTKHVSKNPFINELWIFIFKEVKWKSHGIRYSGMGVRDIFEARGDLLLNNCELGTMDRLNFQTYITKCNYDSSILYWHIATEWWYNEEEPTRSKEREFSKILSDYMLYLLLNQPNVMFAVAGNAQFTSAEILQDLRDIIMSLGAVDMKGLLSMPLSEVVEKVSPAKAGLGFYLAEQMEIFGERKWEVMSGVWVEMLCYAGGHIKGEQHAHVLSKGGELLAFVWLLMAHFGCLIKDPWGPVYDSE